MSNLMEAILNVMDMHDYPMTYAEIGSHMPSKPAASIRRAMRKLQLARRVVFLGANPHTKVRLWAKSKVII